MNTVIVLVRHGITDWNYAGRIQGHTDIPLNDIGRLQAQATGERLASEQWDMIVSSDLRRAAETAEIISSHTNLVVHRYEKRLKERNHGLFEGTTELERIEKWGEAWRHVEHGCESDEDLRKRGMECIEELTTENPGKRIIVVAHGGIIGVILRTFTKVDSLSNASLSIIEFDGGNWKCNLINCVKHLQREWQPHEL